MDDSNPSIGTNKDSEAELSIILRPYRSLSQKGFVILMTAVGLISFAAGLAFYLIGAWPVMGFFGLDALLIYWALKVNSNTSNIWEHIYIDQQKFAIYSPSKQGVIARFESNPYWVNLQNETDDEGVVTSLTVSSKGNRYSIGEFLPLGEKNELSDLLKTSLSRARLGHSFV